MTRAEAIRRAAEHIAGARVAGERLDRLPAEIRPADEREGYAVQEEVHRRLAAAGRGPLAGRKIGCTSAVMQHFLGIDHPCAGGVPASLVHTGAARIPVPRTARVGVECEIAVRLARDLPWEEDDPPDPAAAVGSCMAAIEIVEDRYVDYATLDTPTLIADDFFAAGCVLGPERPRLPPGGLADVGATMLVNGEPVGRGTGRDVLGDPLNALAWLARSASERGAPLRAGELVLLGSLVATHWLEPGDAVSVRNDALGEVVLDLG